MVRTWHWRWIYGGPSAHTGSERERIVISNLDSHDTIGTCSLDRKLALLLCSSIYYLFWERPTSYIAQKRLDSRKLWQKEKNAQVHEVHPHNFKHTDHRRRYHLRNLHCPAQHQLQVHLHPQGIWSCFQILLIVAGSKRGLAQVNLK